MPGVSASMGGAADLRRLGMVAIAIGGVGLAMAVVFGEPMIGLLGCVGLGLGVLNVALLKRSAGMYSTTDEPKKSRFAFGALGRIALVSGLAMLIAALTFPDGIAVLGGLAVFQLALVFVALIPLLKELRESGTET